MHILNTRKTSLTRLSTHAESPLMTSSKKNSLLESLNNHYSKLILQERKYFEGLTSNINNRTPSIQSFTAILNAQKEIQLLNTRISVFSKMAETITHTIKKVGNQN
jgi:hypothetical protein